MAGSSGEVVQAVISEVHPCWGVHWCPGASTEEGSSCSLLGNVPTVLRSLVTHGDTARSCSPSPGASSCRGRVGLNLPCPDQSPLASLARTISQGCQSPAGRCPGLQGCRWSWGAAPQGSLHSLLPAASTQTEHLAPWKGMLPRAALREEN